MIYDHQNDMFTIYQDQEKLNLVAKKFKKVPSYALKEDFEMNFGKVLMRIESRIAIPASELNRSVIAPPPPKVEIKTTPGKKDRFSGKKNLKKKPAGIRGLKRPAF